MLRTVKKITIDGFSVIDDVQVSGFRAEINSENPSDMNLTSYQIDKEAYKANRVVARADEAEFEEYAYAIQDELIAEKEANKALEEKAES